MRFASITIERGLTGLLASPRSPRCARQVGGGAQVTSQRSGTPSVGRHEDVLTTVSAERGPVEVAVERLDFETRDVK
jgi:hypothetical protein